jgi:hypothetical protein
MSINKAKENELELLPSLPVEFKLTKKTVYEAKMIGQHNEISLKDENLIGLEHRINSWLKDDYVLKSVTKIEIPVAHLGQEAKNGH